MADLPTTDEARLRRVGDDLALRLEGAWGTRLIPRPLPHGPPVLELYQVAHVLDLFVDSARVAIWMHGDDEPAAWVRGPVADEAELATVAACVQETLARLTVARLELGARYRVTRDIQPLHSGDVVRFVGFEDVDNHYGRLHFEDGRGAPMVVDGDFANERSAVARVHRYLVRAD